MQRSDPNEPIYLTIRFCVPRTCSGRTDWLASEVRHHPDEGRPAMNTWWVQSACHRLPVWCIIKEAEGQSVPASLRLLSQPQILMLIFVKDVSNCDGGKHSWASFISLGLWWLWIITGDNLSFLNVLFWLSFLKFFFFASRIFYCFLTRLSEASDQNTSSSSGTFCMFY